MVGRRRGAAYLRRALVEPGAEVPQRFTAYRSNVNLPENFVVVRVVTRDGRSVGGVRVNEDTFSLQIRDLEGGVHSFLKSGLSELTKDRGFSPMPAYGALLSKEDLDDVVAYLVSLRGSRGAFDSEMKPLPRLRRSRFSRARVCLPPRR